MLQTKSKDRKVRGVLLNQIDSIPIKRQTLRFELQLIGNSILTKKPL